MTEKLAQLWPEIVLFAGACLVMVLGLSPDVRTRRGCALVAGASLLIAGVLAAASPAPAGALLPGLASFAKAMIAGVGLLLLLLAPGTVDRDEEAAVEQGRAFNPLRTNRAEFYSFFLFSLMGAMLCASADDLIWLFLALELTSLPTYVMVALSGPRGARRGPSHEAAVKYFFLGALAAGTFLFGFALLYGATGTTSLPEMRRLFAEPGGAGFSSLALAGMLLSLVGVSFKIAAVPMHFYAPDVYQGASATVAAFLAFVPKTAGFLVIILLAGTMGWSWGPDGSAGTGLPEHVRLVLWVIAAMTMTVGNVLALLQSSIKRILAYSSIAHSGYMLVGVIAGPGTGTFWNNGLSAVLFYLLAYGVTNLGAFAVIASLERRGGEEIDDAADLRGLSSTHPALGWTMTLCALSLLGFPPLLGFFAKVPLFLAGIAAGEIALVVVLGLNSAIAAVYYLRLAMPPMLERSEGALRDAAPTPFASRPVAGLLSAACAIVLPAAGAPLMRAAADAARAEPAPPDATAAAPHADTR